jgi:S-adenosylmethionine:tRNA ribosyltransferase-isomerase
MRLSDFNYHLPKQLISQEPAKPRDCSNLLVVEKKNKRLWHKKFRDIGQFLRKGDTIVLNKSKVLPARLEGVRANTGGKVEILLLHPIRQKNERAAFWQNQWQVIGKPKLSLGQLVDFGNGLKGEIIKDLGYEKVIKFNALGAKLQRLIFTLGKTPTPPYIHSGLAENKLREKYQTVYAKTLGSVAAPTAGFHFTKRLMQELRKKGVVFKYVTLHVGLGTFQPIKMEQVEKHKMAAEWASIDKPTAIYLNKAKQQGQRIVAVGTTCTRTLESFSKNGKLQPGQKLVDIFIYPGYQFKFVDGLITNFHLPKSTPLLLTCAFAGKALIFRAYREAIKNRYRFYSFGDAMLII